MRSRTTRLTTLAAFALLGACQPSTSAKPVVEASKAPPPHTTPRAGRSSWKSRTIEGIERASGAIGLPMVA